MNKEGGQATSRLYGVDQKKGRHSFSLYGVDQKNVGTHFLCFGLYAEARLYSLETWNQSLNSASPLRGHMNL